LESQDLEKIDSKNMHKIYEDWPNISRTCFEKDFEKIKVSNINHIVFVGMGGSGALGDIFSAILSKTNIHIGVVKGYNLPKTVNENTLVVTISISGNTDETNTVLKNASKLNCKLIAFSSGGKMEQFCKDNNIEFRKIDKFHSPRASFTSFLFSILNILSPIIPIQEKDVQDTLKKLEEVKKQISKEDLSENNIAISLAKWISNTPLIYFPWGLESVAIRFKNSLQENSKIHVIIEDVVESCHNGIVAWERKSNVQPIMIRGIDDHFKTKEKYEILKEYFHQNKIEYKEIFSVEGNILTKIISLIYLLDYVSIYKSILEGIDPSPVKSIEYIKKMINSQGKID
jgi:glucose/mannose-6-phosphate isomerase